MAKKKTQSRRAATFGDRICNFRGKNGRFALRGKKKECRSIARRCSDGRYQQGKASAKSCK